MNIKQNLGLAWFLRSLAWGKLITYDNFLNIKQNLGLAWLFGPLAWGKLITYENFLNIIQNLSPAWLLGPLAWGKSIGHDNFANIRQILKNVISYGNMYVSLGEIQRSLSKAYTGNIYENLKVRVVCEMVRWDSLKNLKVF